MLIFIVLIILIGKDNVEKFGDVMENFEFMLIGVGVFEIEDGLGFWEIGGYFIEVLDEVGLVLLVVVFGVKDFVVSELLDMDWVVKVKCELILV